MDRNGGSRPGMHTADIPSSFSNAALRAVVDTAFCEAGANAEAAAKREAKRTNFMVEFVVSVVAKARVGVLAIFRVQVHRHQASVGFAKSCIVHRATWVGPKSRQPHQHPAS
jgi:hydrogenase-4 membrane subunit HyfE